MESITEIRLQNVDRIIEKRCGGIRSEFARRIDKEATSIGRWWANSAHKKNIGHSSARHIESVFKLPAGWLDNAHENVDDLEEDFQKKGLLKVQHGETYTPLLIGSAIIDHQHQLSIINNKKGKLMLLSVDKDAYAFQFLGHNANHMLNNGWGLVVEPNTPLEPDEFVLIRLVSGEILLRTLVFRDEQTLLVRHPVTGEQKALLSAQIDKAEYCYVGVPPSKIVLSSDT